MLSYSPLRYAGSKRKLFNYLERVLTRNDSTPEILVEPFVGGGSIFINFLRCHKESKVIIADRDELVYSFWKTLFTEPSYLINFVRSVRVNLRTFDTYKYIAAHPSKFKRRKLAAACLFLNRTSFSGILNEHSGPLGGREQKSIYKIDCRFGRDNLIKKLRSISTLKDRVIILPYTWEKTLKYASKRNRQSKAKLLFYLDPPFYDKADQLYRHHFDKKSHKKLRNKLTKLKWPWILSYDRAQEIRDLYSDFPRINISMPYSINSPAKRLEKELIITKLKLPRIK